MAKKVFIKTTISTPQHTLHQGKVYNLADADAEQYIVDGVAEVYDKNEHVDNDDAPLKTSPVSKPDPLDVEKKASSKIDDDNDDDDTDTFTDDDVDKLTKKK